MPNTRHERFTRAHVELVGQLVVTKTRQGVPHLSPLRVIKQKFRVLSVTACCSEFPIPSDFSTFITFFESASNIGEGSSFGHYYKDGWF